MRAAVCSEVTSSTAKFVCWELRAMFVLLFQEMQKSACARVVDRDFFFFIKIIRVLPWVMLLSRLRTLSDVNLTFTDEISEANVARLRINPHPPTS